MLKVNNKNTRTTSMTSFYFAHISILCLTFFNLSVVDFEQVNVR